MSGMQEILAGFDTVEVLIIRLTGLAGIVLICYVVTCRHIGSLRKDDRKKPNRGKAKGHSSRKEKDTSNDS